MKITNIDKKVHQLLQLGFSKMLRSLSAYSWDNGYFKHQLNLLLIVSFLQFNFADEALAVGNSFNDTLKFKNGSLNENVEWHDNRGELINAHDGGIIEVNGKYYWYGHALRPLGLSKDEDNGAATTTGIALYSSTNLHNWNYEGVILAVSTDTLSPLRAPMRLERPKIIYNKKTKKFVLWFHYVGFPGNHGQTVGLADAGVAVANKITGPFKYLGHHRPINDSGAVKDPTLFMDNDTTAYFIYDRKMTDGSRCLHIVKLTDDFLHSTNQWAKIDIASNREAPVVIKHNGVYFMVTSGVSGWKVNAAKVYKAYHIMGPWLEVGNPCAGEGIETTYNSQCTFAFKVRGVPNLTVIMLERHNTENFMRCSYVWLPLIFSSTEELYFPYKKEWSISSFINSKN